MSEDSLMLAGAENLTSSWGQELVPKAGQNEAYYTPDTQINKTERYNELDFNRVQDGKRKQPDYIIVFREDGKIPNMEEAKKAQEHWGGFPIVIIDKDKCLEAEKQKVDEMIIEYNNGNKALAGQIFQKIRNNRQTRENFCQGIDIEEFRIEAQKHEGKKEKKVGMKDLEENYEKTTPQERKNEVSTIRKINTQIQEIINESQYEQK